MAGGMITDYLQQGLSADRPTAPSAATGTLSFYFASDTETLSFYDWNDSAWQDISGTAGTALLAANNLSDVASAATSRTNLGLGTLATQSGTFSGTSSGTNTGDQTITLTGDVTGSGTGSFAATIAAGSVTLTKQADMATASVVYRKTAGAGAPEVQTLATLKTDLGLAGTNTGDQTITLTGDVTGTGTGSFATTLASTTVTPGSYTAANITVDAKGRITAAANGSGGGGGTVTSVGGTGTVNGLTLTGTVTTSGNLTLGGTLTGVAFTANNLSDLASAATARTNLGATTVGTNVFTLADPSAITFLRVNADNTVSALDAATFRTAIGAGTGYTDEQAQDAIGAMIDSSLSYVDATPLLKVAQYMWGFFFTSVPTISEVLALHVAGVAFTIPGNFSGALQSSVGTNPTSSFALDVQNNGSTIGTITVGTGGSVTTTTTSGTAKSIAAGDVLKIVAPGSADATAANMAFTLIGAR